MIKKTLRTAALVAAISAATASIAAADEETSSDENLIENAIKVDRDEVLEERQDARS